jgi:hypothetical protein
MAGKSAHREAPPKIGGNDGRYNGNSNTGGNSKARVRARAPN